MKAVFGILLALLAILYIGAEGTIVRAPESGAVHLQWATDPNPARTDQTRIFTDMHPGIEVSVKPRVGGDQSDLIVPCATGVGPDMVDLYSKAQMLSMAEAGLLLDLTPYAAKMGFGPDDTFPSVVEDLMSEGRQYRFPCNVWANCLVFNKKIFDDHGLARPSADWTWDDFVAAGKKILSTPSRSGEKHLAIANYSPQWLFQDLLAANRARQFSPDGLRSALDSPEAIAAMRMYSDMMHVHKILPTPAEAAAMSSQGGWQAGALSWFSSGRAAMIMIGRWYIVQVPYYPNLKDSLGAVTMPHLGNLPSTSVCGARGSGISATSRHPEEALKFIQYLASPEYGRLIVEGGDSLPPNPGLARTGADMVTETMPDPAFHQPFIDAARNGRTLDSSPFIDAILVERWIQERIDKVENRVLSPREAMEGLAREVNSTIRLNLERRPDLQEKFARATGRAWTPDWFEDPE